MRRGRRVVSEWLAALCSCSGATTQTSAERSRAIPSNNLIPGDAKPSSLVTRTRAFPRSIRPTSSGFDDLLPPHVAPQHCRDHHNAVVALEVLEDLQQCAPKR